MFRALMQSKFIKFRVINQIQKFTLQLIAYLLPFILLIEHFILFLFHKQRLLPRFTL